MILIILMKDRGVVSLLFIVCNNNFWKKNFALILMAILSMKSVEIVSLKLN